MKKRLCAGAVALILGASVCAMPLVGCTAKAAPNTATDLEIQYWSAGFGSDYMYKIVDEFKKIRPDINVHLTAEASVNIVPLYSAPEKNTVDLYMAPIHTYLAYTEYLEPLDELLTRKNEGETLTIGEKVGTTQEWMREEGGGNLYVIPYATTVNGLVYNADIFEREGYSVPRTTNELIALAEEIQDDVDPATGKNYVPFIFYNDYWTYIIHPWLAQMEGVDDYFKIWSATYVDDEDSEYPNDIRAFNDYRSPQEMGTRYGSARYEVMNVMYKLLSPAANTYYGTKLMSHTDAQTRFLAGQAVMMPTGSWLENEMEDSPNSPNVRMMKTPVMSALGTKIGISEAQLAAAVAYVDGEATEAETRIAEALRPDQLEAVRNARSIMYTDATQHTAFIPSYSIAKDAAKDFLTFYFSDDAMKIMSDTTQLPAPIRFDHETIDTSGWSDFEKENFVLSQQYTPVYRVLRSQFFYMTGMMSLYHYDPCDYFVFSQNASDMWNLERYIEEECDYWSENWLTLLSTAGLG